jgi:adenosylmethionine-8-amino-7-oxononanoate aminotransferase
VVRGGGHARKEIVEAIAQQAATLDYAPPFQMGHPLEFEAATKVASMMPQGSTASSSRTPVPNRSTRR